MMELYSLNVFRNRRLRKIFGPKMDEENVTGGEGIKQTS
jgi:hypothetical protein